MFSCNIYEFVNNGAYLSCLSSPFFLVFWNVERACFGAVNAQITKNILSGKEQGPKRDIIILNAGAALYIGGKADSIKDGIALAAQTIDSGKGLEVIENLVKLTNA